MSEPTKGEWRAGRGDMATIVEGYESKYIYGGDKAIGIAFGGEVEDWGEVMANATLMASAPKLLEALKIADSAINPEKHTSLHEWNQKLKELTEVIRLAIRHSEYPPADAMLEARKTETK